MNDLPLLRWSILTVDLDPVVGHEQGYERRSVVVSYEAFHRSGLVTVCPITARRGVARYPNEVPIPIGAAGQTKPGVILCHQVRTISLLRVQRSFRVNVRLDYVTDPDIRRGVREALARQCGLNVPAALDGADR